MSCKLKSHKVRTLSPIGDISFRLIFPRSVSPIKRPIESSSRTMSTKGSEMLQALIFGRGIFPSISLIICLSVPSEGSHGYEMSITSLSSDNMNIPGSRTRMAFVTTWRIAVRWKNGAAPMVVPWIRVVIDTSALAARVAIWSRPG